MTDRAAPFGQPGHVVVVGASLAGLRAVTEARELGFTGDLTLVGAEQHLPYDRPPLSKEFLHAGPESTAHLLPDSERLARDLDVTVRLGTPARGLDIAARTVAVGEQTISYDALLITTGAQARELPGSQSLQGVHRLRTLDDAIAVRDALDRGARTVVVGAGFIGAEVASAAVRRGLTPVVLEAATTPLARAVGSAAGAALADLHHRHGTDLRCGVGVDALVGEDHVEGVRLTDGSVVPADLVVVGVGASPATSWLAESGLVLDDGVVCDELLSAAPDVWAAGDVARWTNPLFDQAMRLEHWTNAGEQAVHAMTNLLDPAAATPYSHVPYFWSDWYEQRIQFAGVPLGDPVLVTGDWHSDAFVALYRDADRLVGALSVNRRGDIMKYRALIARRGSWDDALELAARRNAPVAAPAAPAAAGGRK